MLHYVNYSHVTRLEEPATNSNYDLRSFHKAGPCLWNKLPDGIKQCISIGEFKSKLKTHLFRVAYINPNG